MTKPTHEAPVTVELCPGLPVAELHARLLYCLHLREVGHRGLAFYLAEMDERGLHQVTGHRTAAHYAEGRLEMSRRLAQQLIFVGKALCELPSIDAAFAEGRLSWSKVVLVTRVATPEHEHAWLARAEAATCKELQLAVRLAKPGSAPRDPRDTKGLPEIRYDIRARVDAVAHRAIELAREKLGAERGEPIDDAALLTIAAELILGSDDNGELPGRERIDGSLYRIVLHAGESAGESAGEAAAVDALTLDTPEGRVPLVGEAHDPLVHAKRACMVCDGACSPADDAHPVESDVATPPALRRQVLARDDHRCRCCGSRHGLMAHHIHFRSNGGRTRASNLITLCSHCHALVHADRLVLQGDHAERIAFLDANGQPLEGRLPSALTGVVVSRTVDASTHPDASHPDASHPDGLHRAEGAPEARPEPLPFAEAFAGIVGQDARLDRLRWTLQGRSARGAPFPHTLFCGPAGTGKTTIARALAAHAGAPLVEASGPALASVPAVDAILARLPAGGMLFIDEIHAMPRVVLEHLYEAMGSDGATSSDARTPSSARITVLAATTDEGDLPKALRSRFGLLEAFDAYDTDSLAAIARAIGGGQGIPIEPEAARVLAKHARGTPRTVVHLAHAALDRIASRAAPSHGADTPLRVTEHDASDAMQALGYDDEGFTPLDRRYLRMLHAQEGPVALGRLAAMLGVGTSTLLECVEPFLAARGLVGFTPRGRVAARPLRLVEA